MPGNPVRKSESVFFRILKMNLLINGFFFIFYRLEITVPSFEFNQQPNTLPLVSQNPTPQHDQVKFRRSGSERLKDGAKALLRRVESIKSRRKKRQNREGVVISGPQILDLTHIHQKFEDLKCFDISTSVSNPTSPTQSTNKSPIFFVPDSKVRFSYIR